MPWEQLWAGECPLALIYTRPFPSSYHPLPLLSPSSSWHGRCCPLSHWLYVCWSGHSNVGRLLCDLEDRLINEQRAPPLCECGTVEHCYTVLQEGKETKAWAVCMAASGSHSAEPLVQDFLCPISLCHAWKWLIDSDSLRFCGDVVETENNIIKWMMLEDSSLFRFITVGSERGIQVWLFCYGECLQRTLTLD